MSIFHSSCLILFWLFLVLLFQFECFLFKICIFYLYFSLNVCVCVMFVCVCDVCSCVWLWAYSYEAHVWRSEGSLKNQSIIHLIPCLRQGLSFPLSMQGSWPQLLRIRLPSFHILLQECWDWRCVPLLAWGLGIKTLVLLPWASSLLSELFS